MPVGGDRQAVTLSHVLSFTGRRVLRANDFAHPAPVLAPALIGCVLAGHGVRARITETEAYQGEEDLACHASRGRTPRTTTLYAGPGTLYIYLCYGMHAMLNIVCDRADVPAAVLIRGVEVMVGHGLAIARRGGRADDRRLANGPAKVCEVLDLDRASNGAVLGTPGCPLRLLPPPQAPPQLAHGPRIGVAYAGPGWAEKPWRWWERGFPVVPWR